VLVSGHDPKAANAQLTELVAATGSGLQQLNGIGPSGAARVFGDLGDISRFASRGHFASWNGTASIDASSGDQHRHRLSRAGNRRINRVLDIMAVVQLLRNDIEGRAYYRRKIAAGKTPMEAMRSAVRSLAAEGTADLGFPTPEQAHRARASRTHQHQDGTAIGEE
jgi:transposase